jgi:hypothetical protein
VHFFGYFLCASKESDSAARKADEKTHGREPVLAKRTDDRKTKDKIKMDSGLRRNDGKKMDPGLRRNSKGGRAR